MASTIALVVNERSYTYPESSTADAVLAAALKFFVARGFHGTSMRTIATASGMSVANIYNVFTSKSEILLTILKRASVEQFLATEAALEAAGDDIRARFTAAVYAFVRYEIDHRDECFVANSELRYLETSARREIIAQRDQQQELFEELVGEGVRVGAFCTPYPEQVCLAILTMAYGVTLWYRPEGVLDADALAHRHARYALALVEGCAPA
jgi:TetR/AcrR family transcriptional regulator, cholesterol catabolism regulator